MAKPNKIPTWATDGSAQVLEPSVGKRAVGWLLERPAFQYTNWLFNIIGTWLGFVDTQFASDGVKRVAEVADLPMLKGLTPDDGDVCRIAAAVYVFKLGDSTAADDVLVVADNGGTGRWLHVSQPVAGVANGLATLNPGGWLVEPATRVVAGERTSVLRVFGTNDGDVVGLLPSDGTGGGLFVWDADGTQTVDDVMVFDHISGGPGRWLHAARHARGRAYGLAGLDSAGKVEQEPASKAQASGIASLNASSKVVQDPASKGLANGVASLDASGYVPGEQLGGTVTKKWGVITTGAVPAHVAGSETFTFTATSGSISIFFAPAMPNTNYAVVATVRKAASSILLTITDKQNAGFTINLYDVQAGALLAPNSDVAEIDFMIVA